MAKGACHALHKALQTACSEWQRVSAMHFKDLHKPVPCTSYNTPYSTPGPNLAQNLDRRKKGVGGGGARAFFSVLKYNMSTGHQALSSASTHAT
eukprot:1143854-Pelagomonas_calceolata.AAC.2